MPLVIHRSRSLFAVVAAIGLLGAGYAVLAQGGEGATPLTIDPIDSSRPELPALSADEEARALEIVRRDAVVGSIVADRPLRVTRSLPLTRQGAKFGAALVVAWEGAVESNGPWKLLRCHGTRVVEGEALWRNVSELQLMVDLQSGEVLSRGVSPASGAILADTDPSSWEWAVPDCPPGLEDNN